MDKEGENFEASTSQNENASGKKIHTLGMEDIIINSLNGYTE